MGTEDPTLTEMFNEAIDLFEAGRISDALHHLGHVLRRDNRHPGAWYYKGRCLERTGDLEQALRCFETAARLAPHYAAAHCEIGFCLNAMGRYEDALSHLAVALDLDPTMDAAIINSGYAYEHSGQFDKAVAWYKRVIARDPLNATGWQNLGSCLLTLGHPGEALECFQGAYELGTDEEVKRVARLGIEHCRNLLPSS
jgi:tetratricopeptide (TPR) repeat protein